MPVSVDNKRLLIKKRAHHLERFLFRPGAYSKELGERMADELERLLEESGEERSSELAKWAHRILHEFREGTPQGPDQCLCPLLKKETQRPESSVATTDLMTLMRRRRSRRVFADIPLTCEERIRIATVAQWTPSSCNRQTLELIFVEDPTLKALVASTVPGGHQFFQNAPCIIVVIADARDYRYPEDRMNPFAEGAAAIQNIYLLCETMKLGCCWGSYTSFGSVLRENEVREKLGIPPTHIIVGSLAIGKSEQAVCEIPRDHPETRYGINYFRGESA